MNDGEALILAIRANRDDDTPRLIYADWLEEQGDPVRAEFVRLQCWLSAHPEAHPHWEANWQREQQLLADHGTAWAAAAGGYSYDPSDFDRGFPSYFYIHDVREFTWIVDELTRITATDRLLVSRLGYKDVGVLGGCPGMQAIAELVTNATVHGLSEDGITELVRSPHVQGLARLDLSGTYHNSNEDALVLAREPVMPVLRDLHLALGYRRSVGTVIELLESPHRNRLRGLEVCLGEAGVLGLCRCPALARLRYLDFGCSVVTDAGAQALAQCPYLDGIELLAYAGSEDQPPLSRAAEDCLRERFGDRVVLDPRVHIGGPIKFAYCRRVVTGRWR
jgi:uncharacterized protein (TIGR02996 family)